MYTLTFHRLELNSTGYGDADKVITHSLPHCFEVAAKTAATRWVKRRFFPQGTYLGEWKRHPDGYHYRIVVVRVAPSTAHPLNLAAHGGPTEEFELRLHEGGLAE